MPHDRFIPSFSLTQLSMCMYVLCAHKWQFEKLSKKKKKLLPQPHTYRQINICSLILAQSRPGGEGDAGEAGRLAAEPGVHMPSREPCALQEWHGLLSSGHLLPNLLSTPQLGLDSFCSCGG